MVQNDFEENVFVWIYIPNRQVFFAFPCGVTILEILRYTWIFLDSEQMQEQI